MIEGQPHVCPRIHPRGNAQRGIAIQSVHHLAQRYAVFRPQFDPETLVQFGDDLRQRLHFLRSLRARILRGDRIERGRGALQIDLAPARLLNAIRLHVDVLLHLDGQRIRVRL